MTSELPNIKPAGRYNVSETARILGVSRDTVYSYSGAGDEQLHYTYGANNRRIYKGIEILRFWNLEI